MKETGYLLQAALICAWWVGLTTSQVFFDAFQFDQIPPVAFWSFFLPDIALIASLSVVRAYYKSSGLEKVIFGAFAYATLYCVQATALTGSGFLSSFLMLAGLAFNALLCFDQYLFRSSSSSRGLNIAKTLIQIVCIWTITLVVIPYVILDAFHAPSIPSFGIWVVIGMILFLCFSCLGLASAYFMLRDGDGTPLPLDQTNKLVVSGPYRYVRNPMAIAGIGQGIAIACAYQSLPVLVYAILGGVAWQWIIRPLEERDLVNRFGESYLEYCRQVRCWLPSFR